MGKTRGVHETTPEIRNRMVGMYEAGLGLRDIAAAVNCSQRTVKRWLNRFDKEGTVETRDRCGRKRATTQEQDEAIIRLATQTPITAAKTVLPALGLNCSVDTVRERLHKAGIHNWSPSKKHIQKISVADGFEMQQAVWRPTGTQLGKKKCSTGVIKIKNTCSQSKKKTDPHKSKDKPIFENNGTSDANSEQMQPNFSFSHPTQNNQMQLQINNLQPVVISPPSSLSESVIIPANQNQYSQSLNLIPHSQLYHHHQGLNISQNWPLDLVQGTHHFTQDQQTVIHEQHSLIHVSPLPQLHNDLNAQLPQHVQNQIQPSIHEHHAIIHQKTDPPQTEHHQELSELSQENLNETQDIIVNECSDACSNSNSHSNESNQNSVNGEEISSDNNSCTNEQEKISKTKRKKGGKVKGILETSLEIRNRMIGMSEAGLSTLSIALSLNRSERTVKRWLDRWYKEGNVQTKERKGRRRITTKEEDEAIVAMATQNPLTAAKFVAPALGLKCSVDTIRERLHKAGIHSWKLGKKQGDGNAVHTVHLWQPSGNRSNKVKINADKKKKHQSKKRTQNPNVHSKQSNKVDSVEMTSAKTAVEHTDTIIKQTNNIPYQNASVSPVVMSTMHDLTNTTALVQSSPIIQHSSISSLCSQVSTESQTLQPIGPIIQARSDCRLAISAVVPAICTQSNTNITYPSCMMGNTTHTGQMEQSDPMNYEPYIWSF